MVKIFGISENAIITFEEATYVQDNTVLFSSDKNLICGDGAYFDKENNVFKSSKKGFLRISKNKVYVDSLIVIEKNFNPMFQPHYFDTSLWIKGDLLAGTDIFVNGNLQIDGIVENCKIKCSGDAIILGSFYGLDSGEINAQGNIFIKEVNSAKIKGKDIIIGNSARFSNIIAKGSVIVKGKGEIIGGKVYAKDKIIGKIAGSKTFTKTLLACGYDYNIKFFLDSIKNRLIAKKKNLKKNQEDINTYFQDFILETQDDYIDFILKNSVNLYSFKSLENIKLIEEISKLEKLIKKIHFKNFINFKSFIKLKKVYPGVELRILEKKYNLKD